MKGDLDKDGVMSEYEQARQDAIDANMREQKALGGIPAKLATLFSRKSKLEKELMTENMSKANQNKTSKEIEKLQKQIDEGTEVESKAILQSEMSEVANKLKVRGFSDDRIDELLEEAFENRNYSELEEALSRTPKQIGGSMDDQMMMVMKMNPIESDTTMEDNYTQFIMEEALTEDEEDMLMSKLEKDEELSMLFDKVIDVAQEFAGSGPVDGPGSGVSDSIPARLSDGEFVFTAKATEEIGADELMRMMKDAEANADKRQQVAVGGMLDSGEEEIDSNVNRQQVTNEGTYIPEEDTTVRDKIRETMLDPSAQSRYVRS